MSASKKKVGKPDKSPKRKLDFSKDQPIEQTESSDKSKSRAHESGDDKREAPVQNAGGCSCFAIFLVLFSVITVAILLTASQGDRMSSMPVAAHQWLEGLQFNTHA